MKKLSADHKNEDVDRGLKSLLELDGSILEMGEGFWVKIVARQIPADAGRPAGINYSLTLHCSEGRRLLGYDNAHPVNVGFGPGGRSSAPNDHIHRGGSIVRYPYQDAYKLVEDFWVDVNRILKQREIQ